MLFLRPVSSLKSLVRTSSFIMLFCRWCRIFFSFSFFLRVYMFTFRERREGEERQGNIDRPPPPRPLLKPQPETMHPDRESNRRPLGSQAGTQPTEPQQPGWLFYIEGHIICERRHFHIFLSKLGAVDFLSSLAGLAGLRCCTSECRWCAVPPCPGLGRRAVPGGVTSSSPLRRP